MASWQYRSRSGGVGAAGMLGSVALFALASMGQGQGISPRQSITPLSGLERSRVNAEIFQPRRLQMGEQRGETWSEQTSADGREFPAGAGQEIPTGTEDIIAPGFGITDTVASAVLPKALQFDFAARLRGEYNSNVTAEGGRGRSGRALFGIAQAAESDSKDDFIAAAEFDITFQARFAAGLSLGLSLTLGYEQYFKNSDFSGVIINSNSPGGVAARFATGDVHWTVFDQFSFNNDATNEPELSGVSDFSQFSNAAGVSAAWSPSQYLLLQGGYTYSYSTSSAAEFDTQDQTSHTFHFTATHPLNGLLQTGLTGSVTFSDQTTQSDEGSDSSQFSGQGGYGGKSTAYGIGPFLRGQLTQATAFNLAGGIQYTTYDSWDSSGGESFYGQFQINNKLTRFYQHSLSLGRDTQLGLLSDTLTTDHLSYSNSLPLGRQARIGGNIFTERSEQTGGPLAEKFTRHGGGVSLGFPLRPTVSASLGWQYIRKDSDNEAGSYSQHRVFVSVSWLF